MANLRPVLWIVLAVATAGCQDAGDVPRLRTEIEEMRTAQDAKIDSLYKQLEAAETRHSQTSEQVLLLMMAAENAKQALLTPGDDGFYPVVSDIGLLTVALKDVKPYASGSKITLKIGNPHSATVTSITYVVEWGKATADGLIETSSSKTKEFNSIQPLKAGSWSTNEIVLDGIPPSDLGYVRVSHFQTSGISLSK